MAVRINDGLRNSQVDAASEAVADSGVLEFRTGTQPASANDAASGTLLASITLPADAFAGAASGSAAKAGTWQAAVTAAGQAGWARMRNSGDTLRMDMSVGQGSGDIDFDVVDWEVDGVVTVDTATLTQPAS
jgi:hypothetical protein